jgi:hypothetical protein
MEKKFLFLLQFYRKEIVAFAIDEFALMQIILFVVNGIIIGRILRLLVPCWSGIFESGCRKPGPDTSSTGLKQ